MKYCVMKVHISSVDDSRCGSRLVEAGETLSRRAIECRWMLLHKHTYTFGLFKISPWSSIVVSAIAAINLCYIIQNALSNIIQEYRKKTTTVRCICVSLIL